MWSSLNGEDMYPFNNPHQAMRFQTLTKHLRCLVCQNESLYDSNAPLALDLRQKVYLMVKHKQSNADIKAYLTKRYGDYVLYKPPIQANTYLLWLAPWAFLLLGFLLLFFIVRHSNSSKGGD